jgi:ATP-dependent Lhr-like helicase
MTIELDHADAFAGFSALTRGWFESAFAAPTAAQVGAWNSISSGQHTLVVAPTGSGKTLAAFLSAIDALATEPVPEEKLERCRVLYISPLKALAADVERNLRSPLAGLAREAGLRGLPAPEISVAIRSGDTPADQRRRQAKNPSDILITTPESLFLILTSQARMSLRGVETVIIDEIHAVAGTKRGAHLAVSLERLDALLPQPAQRIGLSATVQPIDEVAFFLGGSRPVTVVNPPSDKVLELDVVVPVEDLATPKAAAPVGADPHSEILEAANAEHTPSIWPHVENGIVDLINTHTSTLVFANSRRLAERLTARINEIHAERTSEFVSEEGSPADLMAQAGVNFGAPTTLARAHHGSVSKEQRALIEDDLKAGRIPAVVATSSLELGIDMGAVDLVIQVESPPSVASGLQRVGRAGHHVGEVSKATLFPKHRGDLLSSAVVTKLMQARQLEATKIPRNPLDVLAQHIVAMVSIDADLHTDAVYDLVRRSAPYGALPRSAFDAVLDMLAGRYPAEGFSELRPRLIWDRTTDTLTSRPGAQRLAVTSGGTIPDRGLFGVFMVGEKASRVGELDEEMVYESRVGDVFALGATSWRIEDITHDRVLVSPAPGQAGKLPFWHGDAIGRPIEVGRALGELVREVSTATDADALTSLRATGLDQWAAENLLRYIREQQSDTNGSVPTDHTLVIERFRDELGDWRIVLHSPFGAQVHAPWALAIADRVRSVTGIDAQIMHADDGIILRIPDTDDDTTVRAAIDALFPDPDEVAGLVTDALGGSALFASRFRECAARALLLPRRDPGRRTPLWQQRQRSSQLLSVASQYPSFPIIIETVRECLQDVYNVPALIDLLRDIRSRTIEVIETTTSTPSAFARTLLFSYVAAFLYEGDSPLAERRAAALTLDTELLAELLGYVELRDLLDADSVAEIEKSVSYLTPERHAKTAEQAADLLRILGPMSETEWRRRGVSPQWLADLISSRRAIEIGIANERRFAAIEDAARLRDALGTALPPGIPDAFLEPVGDPLGDLIARYARTHGPFLATELAAHLGLGSAVAEATLARLASDGRVVSGEFRPNGAGTEWCDSNVLRRMRRMSVAALRQEIEPVPPAALGVFLPTWAGISRPGRGTDAVMKAVENLAGVAVPASVLEAMILPSRVSDYAPAMLDELTSAGEVSWTGRGRLSNGDGWVCLAPSNSAPLLLPRPDELLLSSEKSREVLEMLGGGGSWLLREIIGRIPDTSQSAALAALWDLFWAGFVTADTFAPMRALLAGGGRGTSASTRRRSGAGPAARTRAARMARSSSSSRAGQASGLGRWAAVEPTDENSTRRAKTLADSLLNRYGIVSRGVVAAEGVVGGFAGVYRVLSELEDAGRTRRGYFIEGLGAAQFATPGAVDQLRAHAKKLTDPQPTDTSTITLLAATDPANPYGAALPWPPSADDQTVGHRPGRKAGALVVLVDGALALYLERGGKSLLTFTKDNSMVTEALQTLARAATNRRIAPVTVEKVNGGASVGTPLGASLELAGFVLTPRGYRVRPLRQS